MNSNSGSGSGGACRVSGTSAIADATTGSGRSTTFDVSAGRYWWRRQSCLRRQLVRCGEMRLQLTFDIRLDFDTEKALIRIQRRHERPLLEPGSAYDHRDQNAVRILHQTLPLQGEAVGDDESANVDQQALPAFREALNFQLDHQAPLYSMPVN